MDKYTASFLAFLAVAKVAFAAFSAYVAPYLVGILIPSIVVALTNKPKAAGVVAFLLKVSRFVAILTHTDEPGTIKAPFGLGTIAKGAVEAFKAFRAAVKSAPKGPALALFLIASLCVSGCAWLAKHPTLQHVLSCGEQVIVETLPQILGDVASALSGQSTDWAALGKLEAQHGVGAVGCAVAKVMAQAEATSADGGAGAEAVAKSAHVSANAHAYMKARGFEK